MKYVSDRILQKALSLKLTETLNALILLHRPMYRRYMKETTD